MTVPLAGDVVAKAATVGTPRLRTLDALHLATADIIAAEIDAFVPDDQRRADAAAGIGLAVAVPA